jgi:CheY-like chemotaxis protein
MARILLIDDDHDILKMGLRLLAKNNHEVIPCSNGVQAIEYLEKYSFDMVISDANMPQMSGFEVLLKIRNHPQWKNMTAALLTGRKTKGDVQRALRLGVDDYIVKPIDPIIFLEKIESLLQKKEPHKWPQVDLGNVNDYSNAKIDLGIKIVSVSELGLTLQTPICPQEGDVFQVNGTLFKDLNLEAPFVKVMTVEAAHGKSNEWIIKTHFVGVKDQFLQQIRSWMYQNLLRKAS